MTRESGCVDIGKALDLYREFPHQLHAGSLHPDYVVADAARDPQLQPVFWHYRTGGKLFLYGFHMAGIPETGWQDIQSPYGYGGPLANTEDADFLKEADAAFRRWADENGVVAEFVRFHPMLENWKYYGGRHEFDRHTVWIDCAEPDLLMRYEVRQRTAIRKAIKAGVVARWLDREELCDMFPGFYIEAMKGIHAAEFYFFPRAYFERLLSLPFISGIAAFLDGVPIAMSLFMAEGIGEYHLSGKNAEGARHSASNLLLHEAAQGMRELGVERLYLGGGSSTRADDSLFFFKSGFSAARAEFRIGKRVLAAEPYEQLKQRHADRYAQYPQRILFYRG